MKSSRIIPLLIVACFSLAGTVAEARGGGGGGMGGGQGGGQSVGSQNRGGQADQTQTRDQSQGRAKDQEGTQTRDLERTQSKDQDRIQSRDRINTPTTPTASN